MMFNRPCNAYIVDNCGNIIRAKVLECTMSSAYDMQPTMSVECTDIVFSTVKEMKDINPDVFQAMLEDGTI